MSEQAELLEIGEQQLISEVILMLTSKALEELNTDIVPKWQCLNNEFPAMGIYTMQGAIYLERCIDDSFTAQYPFMIRYAAVSNTNEQRMKAQSILDEIGEWMENIQYPELSDGRTISRIERTATSYLYDRTQDGVEVYQCNMNLVYEKRGLFG